MQFYGFIRNLPPLSTSNCFAHVFNIRKGQNLFESQTKETFHSKDVKGANTQENQFELTL